MRWTTSGTSSGNGVHTVVAEPGEGRLYTIGPGVARAFHGQPYERRPEDPLHRPLRIFALDPTQPKLEGSIATVKVPYEPIEPGFRGSVFEVDTRDGVTGQSYRALDLDDRRVLLASGRDPSPGDPLFHQQMVYAVASLVYARFKTALGRHLAWGFDANGAGGQARLRLRPYAENARNAWYDKERGEIAFGYFEADAAVAGRNVPRGLVFTSLQHDVIVHEVTHALVDGLREHLMVPSGPDTLAFHEGFADLVALFQRFSYEKVVDTALGRARGRLEDATDLAGIARQFGETTGRPDALRTALDGPVYDPGLEEHALGAVLGAAVFEAFMTVFRRKTARYLRLATGGTGTLPPGELPTELRRILSERASRLAGQFLEICVRAVDYCPPVDVTFGEFLRALITADHDLVPDDPWGYREAFIDAFRARKIYPGHVRFLSEDALRWQPPIRRVPPIQELTFAALKFRGDPGRPADIAELRRQAVALGRVIGHREHRETFGLAVDGERGLGGDRLEPPQVHSIRTSRRVGPDDQVVFDLVAEVTQMRHVAAGPGRPAFEFLGGSTVILGPDGGVRYTVAKSVLNQDRLDAQMEFMTSDRGRELWTTHAGRLQPTRQPFKLLHDRRHA